MKKNLISKEAKFFFVHHTFILLTICLLVFFPFNKTFSSENTYVVNNIEIEGKINLNFTREKYLEKAFLSSFDILMKKILLSKDLRKIRNIKLNQIKRLISSFQIIEEKYNKDKYYLNTKIIYNDYKVRKFLSKKNISFSEAEKISAIFYPVLFINDEIKNLNDNYFYNEWTNISLKNEVINFILPIESAEDISNIIQMKDNIENLNIYDFVNKYEISNYVFALMDYKNTKLNIYLKINFNDSHVSKNIIYDIKNIDDKKLLNNVLKDLKLKIFDIWKEENLINLLMPLTLDLKFKYKNLNELDALNRIFTKISIIDNYKLNEFNINNSFYKIYYYSGPKKLKTELNKFGYDLKNINGNWELYLNE